MLTLKGADFTALLPQEGIILMAKYILDEPPKTFSSIQCLLRIRATNTKTRDGVAHLSDGLLDFVFSIRGSRAEKYLRGVCRIWPGCLSDTGAIQTMIATKHNQRETFLKMLNFDLNAQNKANGQTALMVCMENALESSAAFFTQFWTIANLLDKRVNTELTDAQGQTVKDRIVKIQATHSNSKTIKPRIDFMSKLLDSTEEERNACRNFIWGIYVRQGDEPIIDLLDNIKHDCQEDGRLRTPGGMMIPSKDFTDPEVEDEGDFEDEGDI